MVAMFIDIRRCKDLTPQVGLFMQIDNSIPCSALKWHEKSVTVVWSCMQAINRQCQFRV